LYVCSFESFLYGAYRGEEFRKAQLDEAKAGFFPKLEMQGILAPMYEITGNPNDSDSSYDTWKPYYLFDARLIFPIFTSGRVKNYKLAAQNGIEVAKSETGKKALEVILATKEFYYQYQLSRTLYGVVKGAKEILEDAIKQARKLLKKKKIKTQDLLKLQVYYATALEKFELAKKGLVLAKAAVGLQMGLSEGEEIKIKDTKIAPVPFELRELEYYQQLAKEYRPEYKMVRHWLVAQRALVDVERANHFPNFFVGSQLEYRKTDNVEDQKSAFAYDDYNDFRPGIGVGFQWKWDYGTVKAKIRQANAEYMKIVEKGKFATLAIPMDVKRCYYDLKEARNNMDHHKPAMKAAKKWMIIEVSNYTIGINEAEDLLEAVGADAISKYNYYNAILKYNMAVAKLSVAVGKEVSDLKY